MRDQSAVGLLAIMLASGAQAADSNALTSEILPSISVRPAPATPAPSVVEQIVVTGFLDTSSAVRSTGLDGATHTLPLSVVSLSRQEMERRGARDLTQALQTVASVNVPVGFQLQAQGAYDIRGFSATVLYDGFSSLGNYGDRDSLAGVERIDFIKGPGSALNSGALGLPPGGVIDIHSAWPGQKTALQIGAASARYGQRELQLEADSGELLPVVSIGLAVQRGAGEGFFDYSRLEHQKLRPSLSLRSHDARLSFYYEDSRRTSKDYPGLPTTGTLDQSQFSIPDQRSINDPDVPLSRTTLWAYGLDLDASLTSWLSLSAAARSSESSIYQASEYISSNTPDVDPSSVLAPSTFRRSAATYVGNTREQQARLRLTGRFDGQRYGRFSGWLGYGGEDAPDQVELRAGAATPLDVVNPRYGQYTGTPLPFSEARSHFHIRNASTGLQWQYDDWFKLFGAFTSTRGEVRNRQTSVAAQLVGDLFGPNAQAQVEPILQQLLSGGVLPDTGTFVNRVDHYDLHALQFGGSSRVWDAGSPTTDDGLWMFYGQGNGQQFRAYFTGDAQPRPELSDQHETGLRLVNSEWGKLELAAFRIQRRNVPTLDPNSLGGFTQITTGLQSVRGADLESTLRLPYPVIERFSLNGSAAWLKSRIDQDTSFAVGNRLTNVPGRNWRLQLAVEALRSPTPLRLFIAQRCRSAVAGDLSNSFMVPGHCLRDAGASLSWNGVSVDAVVSNLDDTRYYEPYTYLSYAVIPGERRNVRLSLNYRFGEPG